MRRSLVKKGAIVALVGGIISLVGVVIITLVDLSSLFSWNVYETVLPRLVFLFTAGLVIFAIGVAVALWGLASES
ncbi:MAG: hypothetical protein ACE5JE_06425 [Thermoplasmata archaeon]